MSDKLINKIYDDIIKTSKYNIELTHMQIGDKKINGIKIYYWNEKLFCDILFKRNCYCLRDRQINIYNENVGSKSKLTIDLFKEHFTKILNKMKSLKCKELYEDRIPEENENELLEVQFYELLKENKEITLKKLECGICNEITYLETNCCSQLLCSDCQIKINKKQRCSFKCPYCRSDKCKPFDCYDDDEDDDDE
jgi:hypothetical protein